MNVWGFGGSANASGLKEYTDLKDSSLSSHSPLLHMHISPRKWTELLKSLEVGLYTKKLN